MLQNKWSKIVWTTGKKKMNMFYLNFLQVLGDWNN